MDTQVRHDVRRQQGYGACARAPVQGATAAGAGQQQQPLGAAPQLRHGLQANPPPGCWPLHQPEGMPGGAIHVQAQAMLRHVVCLCSAGWQAGVCMLAVGAPGARVVTRGVACVCPAGEGPIV